MGIGDAFKRQFFKGGLQRPWDKEWVVQIVGIKPHGEDMVTLDVLYFPEEVSVWQPPTKGFIRTTVPEGVHPHVGKRLVVGAAGGGSGNNTPPPVYWDRRYRRCSFRTSLAAMTPR